MRRRFWLALGIGALYCLGACDSLEEPPPLVSSVPGKQQLCPFPLRPDRLDGDLGDTAWEQKNLWQSVDHTMGNKPATSDADASFEFACVADLNNMYFAFRIRDDVINTNGWDQSNAYDSDSIEIIVDQCYRCDIAYNGDDSQIIIGADSICGQAAGERQIGGGLTGGIVGSNTGTQACSRKTSEGWQAEIAVPLQPAKGWYIEPEHELFIGFQTGYNDNDDTDSSTNSKRDHKLIWGEDDRDSDQSFKNPQVLEQFLFYAVPAPRGQE